MYLGDAERSAEGMPALEVGRPTAGLAFLGPAPCRQLGPALWPSPTLGHQHVPDNLMALRGCGGAGPLCAGAGAVALAAMALARAVAPVRRLCRSHAAGAARSGRHRMVTNTAAACASDGAEAGTASPQVRDKTLEIADAAALRRDWESSYAEILDGGFAGEGHDIYVSEEDEEDEDICELMGLDLGQSLENRIGREFSAAERSAARSAAGFDAARSTSRPHAVWLIGPSASGKSTLTPRAAQWTGMDEHGYVTVDGEFFRDAHGGYQAALESGHNNGCVWWGAYTLIRENVNKEKQLMLREAVEAGKNLAIPSTCLRKSQCVDVAAMLLERGYQVHIVGIYGEKEEIIHRGKKRAATKGKRYDPREFILALRQFAPMLRLCNGQYWMVCSTSDTPFSPTDEGKGPLSEEEIQAVCGRIFCMYSGAPEADLPVDDCPV